MNTFELLKLYAAGERDFPETKLSNAHLVGENLSAINLTRSILWATDLSNTILKSSLRDRRMASGFSSLWLRRQNY